MPSEAWNLVDAGRSRFTLTDSQAYKPGESNGHDRCGEHPDETALADFSSE